MTKKIAAIFILFAMIALIISGAVFKEEISNFYNNINWEAVEGFYLANELLVTGLLFVVYIAVTAFSIPGATLMTLTIGVLLGLWKGVLVVSFASSIGATLAFLIARYFFRDALLKKYPEKFEVVDHNIEKNGVFYLLTLRLIPIFPFFLVNILMGMSRFKTWKFYIVSQLGMLPATIIYINAADSFKNIKSFSEIYTPRTIIALLLLIALIIATKIAIKIRDKREQATKKLS